MPPNGPLKLCDLDLGCGNLNFVRDTPSHCALPTCEV